MWSCNPFRHRLSFLRPSLSIFVLPVRRTIRSISSTIGRQTTPLRADDHGVDSLLRRCNMSSSATTMLKKAGRQRFYIDVGVSICPAPWEAPDASLPIEPSPISAGVDGTDSASGVVRPTKTQTNGRCSEYHKRVVVQLPPRQLLPLVSKDNTTSDSARPSSQWYTVTLDGRSLRTPMGRPLSVPSQLLAYAIAVEWNNVSTVIVPLQMPLMTLVCTALDQSALAYESYEQHCLNYLQTDTIGYWADPVDDRVLYGHQQSAWQSLYAWIEHDFAHGLPLPAQVYGTDDGALFVTRQRLNQPSSSSSSSSTSSLMMTRGLPHAPALMEAATAWVQSLDAWHLTSLYVACAEAKSFWIAAAVVTQQWDATHAQLAARVEEEFNISAWGCVEGQHDYDRLNSAVQLRAASMLVKLLQTESSPSS